MKNPEEALKYSLYNKYQISNSLLCGCYYCLEIFKSEEIRNWIDRGETALCPYCGIDTVLGDASVYEIEEETLKSLNNYWY